MIKEHAVERIETRLKSIDFKVDQNHLNMLCKKFPKGKHYIRIALLGKWVMTSDGSYGDCVTAIIRSGIVQTVMLSEKSQRWHDGTFRSFEQKG